MRVTQRAGTYYRVCKPEWSDPLSTAYAKERGGRWNPPSDFGALYLNRTIEVAAASARSHHRGRAIGLFDLRPERRPMLLTVDVPRSRVCDAVSAEGIHALRVPKRFPFDVSHERCQRLARSAHANGLRGVAARSTAECTDATWIDEELAWFDSAPHLRESEPRQSFEHWYPDVIPPSAS